MTTLIAANRPAWLRKRLVQNGLADQTRKALAGEGIHTVCVSALCPNQNECFSYGRATFLILGDKCTRRCAFCSVKKGVPENVDGAEAARIAALVRKMGLRYAVITSVTRDDLVDGGSGQFAMVVGAIKESSPDVRTEVLVPDFGGNELALRQVVCAHPDVIAHNIETVERLYTTARQGASYECSLEVLRRVKACRNEQLTKSSIMVGLGEDEAEVFKAMRDLRGVSCDMVTLGQYLRPRQENLPVARYVTPEEFDRYKKMAVGLGFKYVAAGPFVRSSYLAEDAYNACKGVDDDRN